MRTFTKARENRGRIDEEFELEVLDWDDELVKLKFHIVRPMHSAGITALMAILKRDPAAAIGVVAPQIARILDDKDGVATKWAYPDGADNATWTGPDGREYDANDTDARTLFEMFESGSSRRRWTRLMDPENEEYGVDLDDLIGVTQFMVELSSGRPTTPPA